jgi:hypothetical protein
MCTHTHVSSLIDSCFFQHSKSEIQRLLASRHLLDPNATRHSRTRSFNAASRIRSDGTQNPLQWKLPWLLAPLWLVTDPTRPAPELPTTASTGLVPNSPAASTPWRLAARGTVEVKCPTGARSYPQWHKPLPFLRGVVLP